MLTSPRTPDRVTLGGPDLPDLSERVRHRIRTARPAHRCTHDPLPRVVIDAGKPGIPLLTWRARRAIDALADRPDVPIAALEAIGWELIAYVRARRCVEAPTLADAMKREEAAGLALNHAQWCGHAPRTAGDLHALRDAAGAQLLATSDLLGAIDAELGGHTRVA